ncbi:unnamed protein product [Arabidopsis lyrata]|uniref:Predicted protein n=1 Tax=Arabidopsis lyrata subsp. lyrata TaxID=81972 RepID=D7LWW9_ARALL|nr:predicted protein [Arabidopsis lyrata subsp. lyrata]CAH8271355.1 unnamed protein product [Arabidopsis lyrata]
MEEDDYGGGGIGAGGSHKGKKEFGDGSRLIFDLTGTHLRLLGRIVEQSQDDCWARVLRKILEFAYNRNIENVAEQIPLSMKGLINKVKAGREIYETGKRLGKRQDLTIDSLKKPIDYIREKGLEKDFGRTKENMFRVRGSFTTKPNATPNDIRDMLLNHGVVGIYVYMEENFSELKEEIYTLNIPQGAILDKKKHVLIIVAYGLTRDDKIFFLAQNTWGKEWGVGGYGRIIVADTCSIFYVDGLLK